MDFMKMMENWRHIVARSVLAFHFLSVGMGVVLLLSVISVPYLLESSPSRASLGIYRWGPVYAGVLRRWRRTALCDLWQF